MQMFTSRLARHIPTFIWDITILVFAYVLLCHLSHSDHQKAAADQDTDKEGLKTCLNTLKIYIKNLHENPLELGLAPN